MFLVFIFSFLKRIEKEKKKKMKTTGSVYIDMLTQFTLNENEKKQDLRAKCVSRSRELLSSLRVFSPQFIITSK